MSPKPVIETSQYDPRTHDEHPALCECAVCMRLRYPHLYGYPVNKPGMTLSLRAVIIAVLLSIPFWAGGVWIATEALAKTPRPMKAPRALLEARFLCPNTASVPECRGELRKALQAVAWQKHHRKRLQRRLASLQTPVEHLREWTCIHSKEGAWNANTGNGYQGGLQMDHSFSTTYGPDMWRKYGNGPHTWTPRDQMIVAERAYDAGRGFHPWPNTARRCGLIR